MVSGTDYDALADLFLSEGMLAGPLAPKGAPEASPAAEPGSQRSPESAAPVPGWPGPASRPATVEAVILGHLPVYAAPWATQYARHLGEEHGGPVALVRMQGGKTTLDLVGVAEKVDAVDDLEGAMSRAGSLARSWLVRVDELNEAALAGVGGIDRVSVLSGADQAALTSTYRTLKFLHEQVRSHEAQPPALRVVLMGADAPRAHEACEKLRQTTLRFLGEPVEIVVGPRQMGPTPISPLCKPVPAPEVADVVAMARRAGVASAPASRIGPVLPNVHAAVPPMIHTMPGPTPSRTAPEAPPPAGAPGDTDRGRLSRHLAGLAPLPVTCPYAADTELAADARGIVHVLARVEGGRSPGEVISRLVSVAGWVSDHLALLRLAVPAARLSPEGAETTLHLFTDEPKGVRRLLDSGVRLHFLASLEADGRTAWVCRELN